MNTKERILHEALELFSSRGYEAVSMRDISGSVGIRESSLYKHYAGKKGILEAIINMAKEAIEALYIQLNVPKVEKSDKIKIYMEMLPEEVASLCTQMFVKQVENEVIRKLRQFLTIEQYRNDEMRQLFVELFIEKPLMYQEKVFEFLINQGVLKGESASTMALEFFSPFFMLQYKLQRDQLLLVHTLESYTISFIKSHLVEG